MADIRFQFLINGKSVCVTGVEGFAVLSATLSYAKRNPDMYQKQKAKSLDNCQISLEEWARESIGIAAHSSSNDGSQHSSWFDHELGVGDEVTIRVLGPGPSDEPQQQFTPRCPGP